MHNYVPVYQQGEIVSYREVSPQWEQSLTEQIPVTSQDGEVTTVAQIPVTNKDGHIISYQQVPPPKKQPCLIPVHDKNGKLLSFCEEMPKESRKAVGARHESMQNTNGVLNKVLKDVLT
ncbi:hypothetical protein K435DRAFT_316473 [Dendrothele bispora CBS 962.96]|uniref:Uncharacterized protein n=1 Tax=Dendrothele bispora (strain CBS 962.96) TaxID=1314807 RepID=A0A4S8LGW4_DENBC|nr:hypothetical protein K435DRAFT_316473 [Dendrothele bispora CBS 962.96]